MASKKKYTRYTRAHLKHRNIRFWLFYLVLVVLIVLGLMRVHKYFAKQLVDYEDTYYTHVADEAFKVFSEKRFDELFKYEKTYETMNEEGSIEGLEEYIAYQEQKVGDGEIAYVEIAPKVANEKRFAVTVNDEPYAEFTLKKLEDDEFRFYFIPITNSYPWGHEKYAFDNIYMDSVTGNIHPYDYYVPSYATISVNGQTLDESYVSGEDEEFFFAGSLGKYAEGFTLRHYSFDCGLGDPNVTVRDENGQDVPLVDIGDGIFRYEYVYSDEELKNEYEDKAIAFLRQWCLFSTHNVNKKSVTELCVTDSSAVRTINNYEATWITKADKQSFSDDRSWNYTMIDGKVLSCEVSNTYTTVTKGKTNVYPMHLRLYLTKSGGSWKVYDFEMLSD